MSPTEVEAASEAQPGSSSRLTEVDAASAATRAEVSADSEVDAASAEFPADVEAASVGVTEEAEEAFRLGRGPSGGRRSIRAVICCRSRPDIRSEDKYWKPCTVCAGSCCMNRKGPGRIQKAPWCTPCAFSSKHPMP